MAAGVVPYWVVNIPKFFVVIFFSMFALFAGYTHRNVVSVTKHDMAGQASPPWNLNMIAQYVAAYYYGYIIFQLVIGILCMRYGAKWILGIGLLMSSVFTLIIPSLGQNYAGLIVTRIVTGLFQGAAIPGTTALYAQWIPAEAYSIATGIQYSGMYIGTACVNGLSTMIGANLGGWRGDYYVWGILGLVWFVTYIFCIQSFPNPNDAHVRHIDHDEHHDPVATRSNSVHTGVNVSNLGHDSNPHQHHGNGHPEIGHSLGDHDHDHDHAHTRTSESQKMLQNHHDTHGLHRPPVSSLSWGQIFTLYAHFLRTPSCLVFYCVHFCSNWSMYLLMGYATTFLSTVLGLDADTTSLFGFLPYVFLWVVLMVSSLAADAVIKKKYFSVTNVRKFLVCLGFFGPALCMVGITQAKTTVAGSAFFICAITLSGAAIPGFFPMALDIGGEVGGLVIAVSNTIATIPGIAAPLTQGALTQAGGCVNAYPESASCVAAWQTVFYIAIAVYAVGGTVCLFFASCERKDFLSTLHFDHPISDDHHDTSNAQAVRGK
ncbi:major facilitator superfamily domain-containing protein [Polychytrium aggregatum]|uniref:major facilitator superfamily domain-containing protein n=1 Tax=Polychytrium aggregatum TaxID=110093 RepID=UPI0022FE683D|nr:major facilitator superfamily domain-containing protein [Polychytrium aggregatum]KAI9209414.1 major facilitator superfamily domain-containing protein [Polychytrium aggregatum]